MELVGLFIGKALQQGHMPGLCLSIALWKMILGMSVEFADLADIDSGLYSGLQELDKYRQRAVAAFRLGKLLRASKRMLWY